MGINGLREVNCMTDISKLDEYFLSKNYGFKFYRTKFAAMLGIIKWTKEYKTYIPVSFQRLQDFHRFQEIRFVVDKLYRT